MKKRLHPVTDHAVVRYLERVCGMDVDAVRAEIDARVRLGLDQGASGVVSGGFVYRLEAGRVVTVTMACRPDPRIGRYRRRREIDE